MDTRSRLTSEQRALELGHVIDPGFVNHRKAQTIQGHKLMQHVDEAIARLPPLPEGQLNVRINHIYTRYMLFFCEHLGIRPLQDVLGTQTGQTGHLFCSTERVLPCPEVYDSKRKRAVSVWDNPGAYPFRVEFHYSTRHIASDTLRSRLHDGGTISIIGQLSSDSNNLIVCEPIIMGFPWLVKTTSILSLILHGIHMISMKTSLKILMNFPGWLKYQFPRLLTECEEYLKVRSKHVWLKF